MSRWTWTLAFATGALCVAAVAVEPPLTVWLGVPAVALVAVTLAVLLVPLVAVPCRGRSRRSRP